MSIHIVLIKLKEAAQNILVSLYYPPTFTNSFPLDGGPLICGSLDTRTSRKTTQLTFFLF